MKTETEKKPKKKRILTEEEKVKRREYMRRWRSGNPDKVKKYDNRWKKKNKKRFARSRKDGGKTTGMQ